MLTTKSRGNVIIKHQPLRQFPFYEENTS